MMKPKVICVLGMHRSGTSCLAGTLEEAGVFLGDVSRKDPYNPKGNHENSKIMALHEDLLLSNEGSWDSPPSEVNWSDRHKIIRDEIISHYEGVTCWGFKDPRSLLTLEGWLEALPSISMVGIFRSPILAAQSFQSRDGFSIEQGIDLWVYYNEKLLCYYHEHRFPIVSFDSDENVFRHKLSLLPSKLDLPTSPEKLNFFDPTLRNTRIKYPNLQLPDHVSRLYETLNKAAL